VGVNISKTIPLLVPEVAGVARELSLVAANTAFAYSASSDVATAKGGGGVVHKTVLKPPSRQMLGSYLVPDGTSDRMFMRKVMLSEGCEVSGSSLRELVLRNLDDIGIMPIAAVELAPAFAKIPRRMSIVMEMAAMDLQVFAMTAKVGDLNTNSPKLSIARNEFQVLAYQLVRNVAYLHNNLIVHGDLKPQNVLVEALDGKTVPADVMSYIMQGRPATQLATFKILRLTDFGASAIGCLQPRQMECMYTTGYRPPEQTLGFCDPFDELVKTDPQAAPKISFKSDMWALACTLCSMAGAPLFAATNYTPASIWAHHEELGKIFTKADFQQAGRILPLMYYPAQMKECQDAQQASPLPIKDCQSSIQKLKLAYPGLWEMVSRMLKLDPRQRADAWDILTDKFFVGVPTWVKNSMPNSHPVHPMHYNPLTLKFAYEDVINVLKAPIPWAKPEYTAGRFAQHTAISYQIMKLANVRGTYLPAFAARAIWLGWLYLARQAPEDIAVRTDAECELLAVGLCAIAASFDTRESVTSITSPANVANSRVFDIQATVLRTLDFNINVHTAIDLYNAECSMHIQDAVLVRRVAAIIFMLMCDPLIMYTYSQWDIYVISRDLLLSYCDGVVSFDAAITKEVITNVRAAIMSYSARALFTASTVTDILDDYVFQRWTPKAI
jgi:serine/threonine protein kinase